MKPITRKLKCPVNRVARYFQEEKTNPLPSLPQITFSWYIFSPHSVKILKCLFIQRDPIGYGDEYCLMNLYCYVGNNPVNRLDPNGNKAEGCSCGPDITDWLKEELIVYDTYAAKVHKAAEEWVNEDWWWRNKKDYMYATMLLIAPQLKYEGHTKNNPGVIFEVKGCPIGKNCEDTVTLCGACIDRSEVGNYLYGSLARMLGMTWYQTFAGQLAGNMGPLSDADSAASWLGWLTIDKDWEISELCFQLSYESKWKVMQSDVDSSCTPCKTAVNSKKNHIQFTDPKKGSDVILPKKVN